MTRVAKMPLTGRARRIDMLDEVSYYKQGGILQYVLKNLAKAA